MAVVGWAVTFGTDLGCAKCNSPPINGQCKITILIGPLLCGCSVPIKRLMICELLLLLLLLLLL